MKSNKRSLILIIFILLVLAGTGKSMAEEVESNDASLKSLRLQYSGISPNFDKNVKEYYLIIEGSINSIDVEVEPENSNAEVVISGNENLKYGKNTIKINVLSEDKSKTEEYIIYVTKTDEPELANTNLETLAIRQGNLTPEFNNSVTKYSVEIANNENSLDILAIPENPSATVEILENDEMQIGMNKIEIIVLAENKITDKKFEITVYRRSESEEIAKQEEDEIQAERLSAILSGDKAKTQLQFLGKKDYSTPIIVSCIVVAVVSISCGIIYRKKKK